MLGPVHVGNSFSSVVITAPLHIHLPISIIQLFPSQVIVLDALDEADPVVPFSAALAAGGGASAVLDGGGGGGGRCPVLVGNRALQLLTTQLQRLPGCVRFFVTTRPDAASGQVGAAQRAMDGWMDGWVGGRMGRLEYCSALFSGVFVAKGLRNAFTRSCMAGRTHMWMCAHRHA